MRKVTGRPGGELASRRSLEATRSPRRVSTKIVSAGMSVMPGSTFNSAFIRMGVEGWVAKQQECVPGGSGDGW